MVDSFRIRLLRLWDGSLPPSSGPTRDPLRRDAAPVEFGAVGGGFTLVTLFKLVAPQETRR
jgi:hypothetical protein